MGIREVTFFMLFRLCIIEGVGFECCTLLPDILFLEA